MLRLYLVMLVHAFFLVRKLTQVDAHLVHAAVVNLAIVPLAHI
jgi:hypothetical protein